MRLHQLRLRPGHDLLDEIERFLDRLEIPFAVMVSAVGSLSAARIRPAVPSGGEVEVLELDESLEIVSLAGLVGNGTSSHLHIAVADSHGNMTGGHLKSGSEVRLGAKIVLMSSLELEVHEPEEAP
jgi:predicted DNA-binding protein with PD1-like motif